LENELNEKKNYIFSSSSYIERSLSDSENEFEEKKYEQWFMKLPEKEKVRVKTELE